MDCQTPFCSVIVPTVGRTTLARAVDSVLSQHFPHDGFEVVVVNDSGNPLPPHAWQQSPQVRVISTHLRKQVVARNAGAAVASGRYLLFLDDDDWLLPDTLHYFSMMASKHCTAGCLFGSFELVDDNGSVLAHRCLQTSGNVSIQLLSGYWMQVAAVMVRSDVYFAAGGFSPLFRISEEIDLFNRIAMCEDFAGQDRVVAHIHRGQSWTTSVDYSEMFEYNRLARDRSLSISHSFARLRQSAGKSSYWHGRIVRLYFVSMLWNWRRKRRLYIGTSRGLFALRGLATAWVHLLSKDFWRAVRQDLTEN
jgi:glycosyltransferase involved in cell wall biosynthesis